MDFSICYSVQERITKNSEKCYVCCETGRLGFFVGISDRFINNPHNIEMVRLNILVQGFKTKLMHKVVILINLVYNWN